MQKKNNKEEKKIQKKVFRSRNDLLAKGPFVGSV